MWTALLTMTLKNVSIKVRKTENQINELTNSESHNIQKKSLSYSKNVLKNTILGLFYPFIQLHLEL